MSPTVNGNSICSWVQSRDSKGLAGAAAHKYQTRPLVLISAVSCSLSERLPHAAAYLQVRWCNQGVIDR